MLPEWYNTYKQIIDDAIESNIESYFKQEQNPALDTIKQASMYALKGGKRIRSILALEFFILFSKTPLKKISPESDIMKFCIALESLHAYSLVHDDLPCMDNDTLRRGEPTTWKKYGYADAVLVGDLLNSLTFEILGSIENQEIGQVLIEMFGNSVGISGMLGGQVLDLYYENNPEALTLDTLIETHNKKTGKLITIAILGALMLANKPEKVVDYASFGRDIGLAFQIKDDLLDVQADAQETGKSTGKSTNNNEEKGFIHFMGEEKTQKYLEEVLENAKKSINTLNSPRLDFIVEYIGNRKK